MYGQAGVRCQACWLKLCLIGYNLEGSLYDKLRLHLAPKDVFRKLLPISSERGKCEVGNCVNDQIIMRKDNWPIITPDYYNSPNSS